MSRRFGYHRDNPWWRNAAAEFVGVMKTVFVLALVLAVVAFFLVPLFDFWWEWLT